MAIYRGPGGPGDAVNDAASEVILVVEARDAAIAAQVAAEAAQNAAQIAETNAETAETNAETAATNAASSASAASTSASNAASSASSASTSATNASNSATAAAASASDALTSETNAAASATAAADSVLLAEAGADTALAQAVISTNKAAESATSATNAANSASAAATSATNAANSATAAASSATAASVSENNADLYRGQAVTAASNAATSETNAAASASAAATSATNASNSASAASTSATNASNSASAAATSATNAANSATAAQTARTAAELAETNAETAETNAAASASAAATSATNASNSASAAATSATNAANSATAAATSATNASLSAGAAVTAEINAGNFASAASTSASNAATSATNAANSATNAANSATAAAASYDSFDDRYLGAKSSAPSVDNDGNTLLVGALYYDTASSSMKVWSGSVWQDAYVSLSGALIAANNLSDLPNKTTARDNLGVEIGVDVQAYDAQLADIAGLTPADNNFIVGNGTNFVTESGATARTSLGLGTIATQNANNVTITGGSVSGITDLAIADGGTGASDAATARSNLGLAIGTNVQAWDADLDTWATKTAPAGTVVGTSDSQTLTNKTIALGSNTVSGTLAQFNTAVTDANLVSIDGTETLTNKTLTSPTINTATISGGFMDNVIIGGVTSASGFFTNTAVSGTAVFAAGTVSAPSITRNGDTNTGIYFPADDTIAFTEGGTEAMRIDSSANVGIGTSSAVTRFQVKTATDRNLGIQTSNDATGIKLNSFNDAGSLNASLWMNGSFLGFSTAETERMRITSGGNVGIGTSSPSFRLQLGNNTPTSTATPETISLGATFSNTAGANPKLRLWHDGSSDYGLGVSGNQLDYISPNSHVWYGAGSERLRLSSDGTITATNIIVGRSSGSTDVNAANDSGSLSVRGSPGTVAAISFHRTGAYAINMGLGTDNVFRIGGWSAASNCFVLDGAGNGGFRGALGIGGTLSLPVNGAIEAAGGTVFSSTIFNSTTAAGASVSITGVAAALQRSVSSIKYKTNVEDIEPARTKSIYEMRPVWYRSKCETDRKDWSYYGLIAEELAEIEPRLVHWGAPNEEGVQEPEGVMYDRLTVLLLAEMKELKATVDAQAAKIAELEAKLN